MTLVLGWEVGFCFGVLVFNFVLVFCGSQWSSLVWLSLCVALVVVLSWWIFSVWLFLFSFWWLGLFLFVCCWVWFCFASGFNLGFFGWCFFVVSVLLVCGLVNCLFFCFVSWFVVLCSESFECFLNYRKEKRKVQLATFSSPTDLMGYNLLFAIFSCILN